MEYALMFTAEDISGISKTIKEFGLCPLSDASVVIQLPFNMPPTVYVPGCMNNQEEHQNILLNKFAFNAYDVLNRYFDGRQWQHWFIAPYFDDGDDMQQEFKLGVFVDPKFLQTVVE